MILLYCQVISVCYHLTIIIKQELYGETKFYSPAILTSSTNKYIPTIILCEKLQNTYILYKSYKSVYILTKHELLECGNFCFIIEFNLSDSHYFVPRKDSNMEIA